MDDIKGAPDRSEDATRVAHERREAEYKVEHDKREAESKATHDESTQAEDDESNKAWRRD